MNFLKKLRNISEMFSIKEDEAIIKCLENNIPLTDENIAHVIEILKQKKNRSKPKILKRVGT